MKEDNLTLDPSCRAPTRLSRSAQGGCSHAHYILTTHTRRLLSSDLTIDTMAEDEQMMASVPMQSIAYPTDSIDPGCYIYFEVPRRLDSACKRRRLQLPRKTEGCDGQRYPQEYAGCGK